MEAKTITKPGKILINEKRLPDEWRTAFDFLDRGTARSFRVSGQKMERNTDHDDDCHIVPLHSLYPQEYFFGTDDCFLNLFKVFEWERKSFNGFLVFAPITSPNDHDSYLRSTAQELLPGKDIRHLSLAGFDLADPGPTFERMMEADRLLAGLLTDLQSNLQPLSEFIDAQTELHKTKERTQRILFNTKDGREIQAQIIAAADRILGEIRKKMCEVTKQSLGDVAQKSIERLNELLANDGEVEFRD